MLKQSVVWVALISCGIQAAFADVIQLKEKASVTGKILAEKRDQVVVDIGYTVLIIPRNQIVKISAAKDKDTGTAAMLASLAPVAPAPASQPTENKSDSYYQTASTPPPIRDVRELVSQLGEAVVQVRTPSGLGSGFI